MNRVNGLEVHLRSLLYYNRASEILSMKLHLLTFKFVEFLRPGNLTEPQLFVTPADVCFEHTLHSGVGEIVALLRRAKSCETGSFSFQPLRYPTELVSLCDFMVNTCEEKHTR